MRRRAALITLGAVGAFPTGCLSGPLGAAETDTLPEGPLATIESAAIKQEAPGATLSEYGIELTTTIRRKTATVEGPAGIDVRFKYTGDQSRSIGSTTRNFPLSNWGWSHDQLYLLPADREANGDGLWSPRDTGCWETREVVPGMGSDQPTPFDPGATVTEAYNLWEHRADEECFPPGTYNFGQTYKIPSEEQSDQSSHIDWTLRIELV